MYNIYDYCKTNKKLFNLKEWEIKVTTEIYTAIIAAVSAILGVIVANISTYYLHRLSIKKDESEMRLEEYIRYINCIQQYMNFPTNKSYQNKYKMESNRLMLIGEKRVVELSMEYTKELYFYTKTMEGKYFEKEDINKEVHLKYQKELVNAMRKDLYPKCEEIDEFFSYAVMEEEKNE